MKKQNRNIRVLAENNGNSDGFHIYLEFSGHREYLMSHRHSGLLYNLLKDGLPLPDLKRWKVSTISRRVGRRCSANLEKTVAHLLAVINDYMLERAADVTFDLREDSFSSVSEAA